MSTFYTNVPDGPILVLEPFLWVGSKSAGPCTHDGKHRIGGPAQVYLRGSRTVLGIRPTVLNGSNRHNGLICFMVRCR
jgi:hypothetical protein